MMRNTTTTDIVVIVVAPPKRAPGPPSRGEAASGAESPGRAGPPGRAVVVVVVVVVAVAVAVVVVAVVVVVAIAVAVVAPPRAGRPGHGRRTGRPGRGRGPAGRAASSPSSPFSGPGNIRNGSRMNKLRRTDH